MGWGAMMGLGQALQQVGQLGVDNHKAKMKEQLEIEKEKRAEARLEARENEAEAKRLITPVGDWQVKRLEDGSLVRQGLNYLGNPIKDAVQPMSNVETEEFNRKRELDELTTKHKKLEVTLSGNKVEHYDEDRARAARLEEARIGSANRANRGSTSGGGGGAAAGDVRSSGLDATTVNSLFAARDAQGNVRRDGKGNVIIDDDALNAYLTSPDYQEAKDKTAGAARWVERQRGSARQGMRREGLPEHIIDDRIRGNTTSEVVKPEGLQGATAKLYEKTKARLDAAEREIEAGNITPDQAAAKFEREGFPQVARQIRAKYGR